MKHQISLFLTICSVLITQQAPIKDIPEINITAVRGSANPPGLKVEWLPIKGDDRILGYRAKAWEIPEHESVIHREENGTWIGKVSKTFDIKVLDKNPETKPDLEIDVPGPLGDSAKFEVKIDQYYQIRVVAYTKDGEGPLSLAEAVKVPKLNK